MSRLKSFLARGVILLAALGADSFTAEAHPGSGVVVDAQGNVFYHDGWLPRVRKLSRDGKVTTLATISKEQQGAQPNRQRVQSVNTAAGRGEELNAKTQGRKGAKRG
jgi:sugar lactone lactonase YvrE